jgi:hypothetical protein
MKGGSKPQGLVGKFFLWPIGKDGDHRAAGEVVEQVDPEHYLIRLGDGLRLYLVPLKAMVFEIGEMGSSEGGSPKYAWEFFETKEDMERAVEEAESWDTVIERIRADDLKGAVEAVGELESKDTRMAVAKEITAALLSPKGFKRLKDAIRRGGGEISAQELADIAKTMRDHEEG